MKNYSKYGKGWYNESDRHRLARLGVKTSYSKNSDIQKFKKVEKIGFGIAGLGGVGGLALGQPEVSILSVGVATPIIVVGEVGKRFVKAYDNLSRKKKKNYAKKRLVGKSDFVWKSPDGSWKWEAMKYEGNGIFYGKVTSPITPQGEYGTWYMWDVEKNGGVLIKGDSKVYQKIKESSKKAQQVQQVTLGWAKKEKFDREGTIELIQRDTYPEEQNRVVEGTFDYEEDFQDALQEELSKWSKKDLLEFYKKNRFK